MKQLLFLLIFILSTGTFAQTKYFIYFKDKGIKNNEQLSKSSVFYQSAMNELSDRCIARRIKTLGEDNVISWEDIPVRTDYISSIEGIGIKIENKLKWFNAVTAYLTEVQVNEILQLDFVDKIEPVKVLKFRNELPDESAPYLKQTISDFPIDYGESFDQLELEDIPIVQSKGITGEDVLIGMLDTGFDWMNHESLQNANIVAEYDFIFHDSTTSDESNDRPGQQNHGTITFSVVGGYKNGSLIGASFGSDFLLAKTEDIRSETHIEEDNYAAALEWMENYGVDITSSSLGYSDFDNTTYSYTYEDMNGRSTIVTVASELAFRNGVLTITSAGNEGNTRWHYITAPADGFNTLGIGAVDGNNNVAGFSSRGPTFDGRIKPDVVALGVNVFGAQAGTFNNYTRAGGTSMSAPIACGIASLLLSAHPHLVNTQLRKILLETAGNSADPDNNRGYGLLSALRAVEFPNLEFSNGSYTLHKMIASKDDFSPATVSLQLFVNGSNYEPVPMEFDGRRTFTYHFPLSSQDDEIEFYITYSDSSGNSFRTPSNGNYKFIYGQMDIALNLKLVNEYSDFIVSEVFPNPFIPDLYSFTTLAVKSSGNEKLRIAIIDASGQQVKVFETITIEGENYFDWNGISDNGKFCASGVYLYLVRLGSKNYGRKMVLIK